MYVCIWGSDRLSKTPSSDLMYHLTASRPKKLTPLVKKLVRSTCSKSRGQVDRNVVKRESEKEEKQYLY